VVPPAQTALPSPAADASPATNSINGAQQASAMPPPAAGAKTPAPTTLPAMPSPVQVAVPVASAGQVYGGRNRNPRVVLRARGDTRVTVRDGSGQILLNRDLKTGDSYLVPNMPGLTMATNDGSAVEVDVDGIAMGRAGKQQEILGRVSLEPQSLSDRFNNH
jgi:cytoskeleton protein RodZ